MGDELNDSEKTSIPGSLGGWQDLLERAFFTPRDVDELFIFDLEVSKEGSLHGDSQFIRRALADSVAAALNLASPADVFGSLRERWRQWAVGSRRTPPPNLAVLALTVAAASEMHHDRLAPSHAYYLRLAALLAPTASPDELAALRDRLDQSFDPVAQWWRDLSSWVDAHPSVGRNTIQEHPKWTRIGYPMSQAIIRRADRMKLTKFFKKLDIAELGIPAPDALVAQLRIWTSISQDLSPTLLAALDDPAKSRVLAEYLHRLASEWDGIVLTPEGATHLDIRLAIDLDDFTSHWVIRMQSDTAPDRLEVEVDGDTVTITRPEYGRYYKWLGAAPAVQATANGPALSVRGTGVSGKFIFPTLQPLRMDPDVGWVSEDDVLPFTQHILLVAPAWQDQIESVLDSAARKGWRRLNQKPGAQLVPGRLVYIKVEIEDAAAFKKALGEIDPSLARALRTSAGFRPRLVNGLRVFAKFGTRHYLQGGEPDLLLPVGEEPRNIPAALDGVEQPHPFYTTGFPIPLRKIGPLDTGRHTIDVDGEEISFEIHEPEDVQPANALETFGWVAVGQTTVIDTVARSAVGISAIAGAVVSGDFPDPILLRRHGRRYCLVTRRGVVREVSAPPANPIIDQVGIPGSPLWEFTPPTDCLWLLEDRPGQKLKFSRIRYWDPHFGSLDDLSIAIWKRLVDECKGTDPLLDKHIRAFERWVANAG